MRTNVKKGVFVVVVLLCGVLTGNLVYDLKHPESPEVVKVEPMKG